MNQTGHIIIAQRLLGSSKDKKVDALAYLPFLFCKMAVLAKYY
jgi:hypothetical protein